MCRPDYFEVSYEINAWMKTDTPVNTQRAKQQWIELFEIYNFLGYNIQLIDGVSGLPDMVFTANGALVIDGKVVLPRFKFPERQPETQLFKHWFTQNGYSQTTIPHADFEGEGDALLFGNKILAGHGFRSDLASHQELQNTFTDQEVISLELVDPRFYHIDTCLTVLNDDTLAYFPGAFSPEAQEKLKALAGTVIIASEPDAIGFGLNTFSDGNNVVISADAPQLIQDISNAGFNTHAIKINEFKKSGGGIKCLTLTLR